ncbi:MAG: UvrB/UvrC motif-containing protein [Opitutales bacterium]|nr:UvrB/UvrC motif-containing protein [Opitutales bacterium]
MEYKCDICGAPATVHITKIVNGQKIKMHLCQSCAQKNAELYSSGFPADIFPQIKKLEEKIMDMASSAKTPEISPQICPKCGSTFADFEKSGRFSCPECYKAFESRVLQILAQMHGAIKHIGKTPKKHSSKFENREGDIQTELHFPPDDSSENGGLDIEKFAEETLAKIIQAKENLKAEPAKKLPEDELKRLKSELEAAVKEERYEDAAALRDKINSLEKNK